MALIGRLFAIAVQISRYMSSTVWIFALTTLISTLRYRWWRYPYAHFSSFFWLPPGESVRLPVLLACYGERRSRKPSGSARGLQSTWLFSQRLAGRGHAILGWKWVAGAKSG